MARIALMAAALTGAVCPPRAFAGEEYENRILVAERPEFDPRQPFSSTSFDGRLRNRVTLVGEVRAAERESGVLQVRVPGCSGCTVLPAPSSAPE